ncbi:hypothetical protein HFO56_01810 [Rhizobium laguerreae]|uniref:hypothetical protein n=1 Tax=Rhizobium laguerreae TaxID=1076926 RepID=UPI001C908BA5|nr:hypothetical protein [Rhizobium laguerreae]MBY3151142.1 hypothetical protein [Rhizobium laguerreae]
MTATPTPAMAETNEVDLIDPRDLKSQEGEMHIIHKGYPIGGKFFSSGAWSSDEEFELWCEKRAQPASGAKAEFEARKQKSVDGRLRRMIFRFRAALKIL